jgi:hypothetical protein
MRTGRTAAARLVCGLVMATAMAGAASAQTAPNTLTPDERAAGWRLLFDGQTTAGWRGFHQQAMPAGWQVVDGALTRVGKGGDIVTEGEFGDFDLAFEWQVAPGGNSGVFFGVSEQAKEVWHTAPEYQILDNAGHKDGATPVTSTGANYALHAPTKDVARPAGQWNQSRIVVQGSHVEHWLNGQKIVEYEIGSPDWKARVAASKFKEHPAYGTARPGRIALQDHGDRVAYRNIKIRTR